MSHPFAFDVSSVLIKGPAPLGHLEVPLRPGLTALYGRNGAGKTRLLDALANVVTGSTSDAEVLVRFHDHEAVAEMIVDAHRAWLGEAGAPDLSHLEPFPWRDPGRTSLETALGDILLERWATMEMWVGWSTDHDGRPAVTDVVDEVVRNPVWMLRLTAQGKWDLGVAMRIDERTPLLSGLRHRLVAAFRDTVGSVPPMAVPPQDEDDLDLVAEEVEAFSAQLCRRDFFTVFGPTGELYPEPSWIDSYWEAVDQLADPARLVPVVTLCPSVHRGPLCRLVTDADIVSLGDLPGLSLDAVRTRGGLLAATDVEPDEQVLDITAFGLVVAAPPMIVTGDEGISVAPWVGEVVADLVSTANALLGDMLPEPPVLRCSVQAPEMWATGDVLAWSATDPSGATVAIANLSGAQVRLVRLSLSLAFDALKRQLAGGGPLGGDGQRVITVVILDEPEAGLHRLAEDRLGRALHAFGTTNDMSVLAATHSSSFLAIPQVALVEVFRSHHGRTSARAVEFPDQAGADSLGISRGELLQLYQLVLLVEGHHERLVLREMLRDELGRRRVLPVPLRGSFNLNAVVDLEILAHTLEQPILAVLDNTDAEAVDRLWAELRSVPEGTADVDEIFNRCLGPVSDRTDEERQIAALARNLFTTGRLDRFHVYGLSRGDIVEYLPVKRLVPGATSWKELRDEHRRLRQEARGSTPKDFKGWPKEHRSADFGDDAVVLAAAVAAESPPEELLGLLARIDSVVDGWTR